MKNILPQLGSCSAIPHLHRLYLYFLIVVLSPFVLSANNDNNTFVSITCNNEVHISLDENCLATINPDDILEGIPVGGNTNHLVDLFYDAAMNQSVPTSPQVTAAEVGLTLYARVTNNTTGNSCWGLAHIEDKLIPNLTCTNVSVRCDDNTTPGNNPLVPMPIPASAVAVANGSNVFLVTNFDPCGDVDLIYSDVESGVLCDFTKTITRTWTATDPSGNTTSCTQLITVTPLTLGDIPLPTDITLECGEDTSPSSTGNIDPSCSNIDATYQDVVVFICEGSDKILRTWTLVDWCTNATLEHVQVIKVLDTEGPSIAAINNISVSTTSNSCLGNVQLPLATVSDDCSSSISVQIVTPSGIINSNGGILTGLTIGNHIVTYIATDGCGNESSQDVQITVADLVAPLAICDEHTKVSLDNSGGAIINALTFDDGSLDNCGIVEYKVRRMDNPNCPGNDASVFSDFVAFTCCDLNGPVMVELRVKDEAGNTNSCMVEVEVEDKLPPVIVCPTDKTIDCTDDYEDLALTGEATANDNCDGVEVTYFDASVDIQCGGAGNIVRVWTATDAQGLTASCVQTISVENANPFNITDTECRTFPIGSQHSLQDDVEWPCDIEVSTCGPGLAPSDLEIAAGVNPLDARPQVFDDVCDFVAVTYEDTYLPIQEPACVKLLRKWIIVDWCQADQNTDPTQPGPGVWHYTQIIKVINSTPPAFDDCVGPGVIGNFEDDCGATFVELIASASDDCTSKADLQYSWELSTGLVGIGDNASQSLENGTYTIIWKVSDGCNNEAVCEYTFTVEDQKQPTPVCLFGTSTTVMPSSGSVGIWATDIEIGSSYDNCTDYADLRFSFSADPDDDYKVIECAEIPSDGVYPLYIYVHDLAGNYDFCQTFILVQDPTNVCGITATIAGIIETEEQDQIEDVEVTLGNSGAIPIVTDATGAYQFIMPYGDYTIEPEKNTSPTNGLTALDLAIIQRHILGLELLDSPYKIIAADANKTNHITALDLVVLRELILQFTNSFPENKSWRFVDKNYVFPNPLNPFEEAFPEVIDLNGNQNSTNDFVGIKVGDVNGTSSPNSLLGSETRTKKGTLLFGVEDKVLEAGESHIIEFKAKDFEEILAYQFTLMFDPNVLDFVGVESGVLNLDESYYGLHRIQEGAITAVWNEAIAVDVNDENVLFSIEVKANAKTQLSEVLELNSRYTLAEAYDHNHDVWNVGLQFNSTEDVSPIANKFRIYQNSPNPFTETTTIGFDLPKSGWVSLKVFDLDGKVIHFQEMEAATGFNTFAIKKGKTFIAGIYYYQIESAGNIATKKMIIIE